jgi:hypothetical protein
MFCPVYTYLKRLACEFISWVLSLHCLKVIEWEGREEGRKKKERESSQKPNEQ